MQRQRKHWAWGLTIWAVAASWAGAHQEPSSNERERTPTRAEALRGEYGPHRSNNDLLYYHLDIRIEPAKGYLSGKNTIRMRMVEEGQRIQLDLYANLNVDNIVFEDQPLEYQRELNAVFVDFPRVLTKDEIVSVDFHYSGFPKATGRFGGIVFGNDPLGRPWIYSACEGEGSSIWWPGKDQWRDEVESMDISISIPNELTDVSNGRFQGKHDLGDGFTRWDWHVHYPINSYNVSVNIGTYEHFGETLGDLTMDYYCLPEDLEKAQAQFAQAKPMMEAFYHYFGEYPFPKDGYKLIQVPYTGMEHQSAVTYGNGFKNGYGGRDWTGVGVSPKFDFIIVHESGHEWFGNAVSAADVSDMWIQEGWTTYLECMYVEQLFGAEDALKYVNGYKSKVANRRAVITPRGLHRTPSQDMYFKGALFLHTLRSVMNDDAKWWQLVREIYDTFKYQNIMTEDLIALCNQRFGRDMTPIFRQYLWQAKLPVLEWRQRDGETEGARVVEYRWNASEPGFQMPIRVGRADDWQLITPTDQWQQLTTSLPPEEFSVATDLYYVEVQKLESP